MTYGDLNRKDLQYMQMCYSAATIFSTCGKKKYAAILVDEYGHIVGFGYNGGPSGSIHCEDGGCPRLYENSQAGSDYDNCIAIHAEQNALLHCDYSSRPKKMFVNGPPCFTCAKMIANSTIKEVYYLVNSEYKDWNNVYNFLQKCGVSLNGIEKWQLEN
jgi:dCMP deaminase